MFIAFSGEESGLLGSAYFTKSELFSKFNITAMLNMDMVGRMENKKLIIYGTGTSPVWKNLLNDNNNYNFTYTFQEEGYGRSDHSSFYQKGIPVLHFFTGTHADYHKPSDDHHKINREDAKNVINLVYEVASDLNKAERIPPFTKTERENSNNDMSTMSGLRVMTGVIPDYSSTEPGLRISGVRSGSPAEKGGIKEGDIVIKFGGKEIKNIYDYMSALAEYKPNDEVDVVVKRNNADVTLRLKLEGR